MARKGQGYPCYQLDMMMMMTSLKLMQAQAEQRESFGVDHTIVLKGLKALGMTQNKDMGCRTY